MARKPTPLAERLWARVDVGAGDECWLWTGSHNKGANTRGGPYGKILDQWPSRQIISTHRAAYRLERGEIPDGYQIDHLCKNTLCCNPDHLEAVPPAVNNARSASPTSANIEKTHCPQGHEYTPENTGYRRGVRYRYCRTCARLAQRAKRERGLSYSEWLEEFHRAA